MSASEALALQSERASKLESEKKAGYVKAFPFFSNVQGPNDQVIRTDRLSPSQLKSGMDTWWAGLTMAEKQKVSFQVYGVGAEHSSPLTAVAKAVKKAVNQVIEIDKVIYGAAGRPVTIKNGGLALSHDAIKLVPKGLQDEAQLITKIAGYGVVAGAAATAIASSGIVDSAAGLAKSAGTAIGTAKSAYGAYGTIKGILTPKPSTSDDEAFVAPSEAPQSGLPIGAIIAIAMVGFVLVVLVARKG